MTLVIIVLIAPLLVLTLGFAVEVFVGLRPLAQEIPAAGDSPSAVSSVPAHDEQAMIHSTIERLKSAAGGNARVLVVADNCTDDTAQIARRAGAEVIERSDAAHRGKGFALDFGRSHLAGNPPDLANLPHGCRFQPRCPVAFAACTEVAPELYPVNGSQARCLRVKDGYR